MGEVVPMDIPKIQVYGVGEKGRGGVSQADFDRLLQQTDATKVRLHSLKDEVRIERARRESLEAEVERLQREVSDLTESLQTARTKVDDLHREREEVERMLDEARIGAAIGELRSALWEQDEEMDGL